MTDDTFDFTGCSLSEPYALQVLGNEMEPEFPDQCIVVIRPDDRCTDGMNVFVVYEQFLVCKDDECGINRSISVRMILHALAHDIRNLVVFAVVHFE